MILWLGGISVLFVCGTPLYRVVLKQRKAADRTEALNHARSMGLSLYEFDYEFGRFPDASTAAKVKADTRTPLTLGSASSNQLFRQLIAHGLKSEKPFYAKIAGSWKPDDLSSDDAHALQPGECGFTYIAGLSSKSDPSAPVMLAPVIRGTRLFDPEPFGGRAVILRIDCSATLLPIDPSGRVLIGGRDIFDPGQGYWRGSPPDIKWQE